MRIGLSQPNAVSTVFSNRLLIEQFSLGASTSSSSSASASVDNGGSSSINRLISLVETVRDRALDTISTEGRNLQSDQRALDGVLAEIADLVGQNLAFGGGQNAILEGINASQIVDYEVRTLRPNATATFSGVVQTSARPARVVVPDFQSLRQSGGKLNIGLFGNDTGFSINAGASSQDVLGRLSRLNGVSARVSGGALEINATGGGRNAPLRVTAQYGLGGSGLGGAPQLEGLNAGQFVSADISQLDLTESGPFTISGARHSLASAAELSYQGVGGAVAGTATFQLGGGLGGASIGVTQGESLSLFAQRVNDLSGSTGVGAEVVGDQLRFYSLETGASASVSVSDIARQADVSVGGVNAGQVSDVTVRSIADGDSLTVSGSVTQAADQARQVLQGDAFGAVAGDASFTLAGALGSTVLTLTGGEALGDVAQRVNDLAGSTGVSARVVGNELYFESVGYGTAAGVSITGVTAGTDLLVSGVNAAQVGSFNAIDLADLETVTLTGGITQAADYARQTYQGEVGGTVADDATFTLTGATGSSQLSITQGESLADVAQRVNDLSATTGVGARTDGDDLVFESTEVGSAQSVQVTLDSVTQYLSVDGINGSQVTDFSVVSATPDSINTLDGSVDQAATEAQLTYSDFNFLLGGANSNGAFTLTGELGSADITVALGQSSAEVRDAINAESATTGIVATSAARSVTLTSVGVGSSAIIEIDVTSGSFDTSGGDGNGNDAGDDAQLTLNGQSVTSSGLVVSYSDALGDYNFTLADGFTGALDTITVTSANGVFDVTGGDAGGLSNGLDALATLNGEDLVATGDQFAAVVDGLLFSFQSEAGFTGAIDPITVESVYSHFSLSGGDASGDAVGVDAQATLNGQAYTGAGADFSLTIDGVGLDVTLATGFVGALDDITIASTFQDFTVTGGDGEGNATGADATATIDGQSLTSSGDTFSLTTAAGPVSLTFQPGFVGAFDDLVVTQDEVASPTTTQTFYGTPGQTQTATVQSGSAEQQGEYLVLKQGGVEIALRLADGFNGELDAFTVRAGGVVDFTPTEPRLEGDEQTASLAALGDLFSAASGGASSLLELNISKTLTLAYEALESLRDRLGVGTNYAVKRTLVGGAFDSLA